jgi:hypothetical protein
MNYFLSFLTALLLTLNITTTHAGGAGGGICMTATGPCESELTGALTKVSTFINTSSNVNNMTKNVILDPIANGIIAIAQERVVKTITSWTKSGFEGNPLVIPNTATFLKNKGLDQVTIDLNLVPQGNIYSDSIFNAIVTANKDTSVKTKLEALSTSNVPSLIQKNICNPKTLLTTAQNETRNKDGTINAAAARVRQTELSNELCAGDPTTDKALEAKLTSAANQNSSLGGWDTFLAVIDGDNEYTRVTLANQVVAKDKQAKEDSVLSDLRKENIVSDTKCLTRDVSGKCTEEVVITPSSVVQTSLSNAANAGLDRITQLQGAGALSSLLSQFAVNFIMSGMTDALSGSERSANSARITQATNAPSGDLLNDPTAKASLLNPITKQLDNYSTSLSTLRAVDTSYLSATNAYEVRIMAGVNCYNSLVSAYPEMSSDGRVTTAQSFYAGRQAKVTAIKNIIIPELSKITEANQLINTTRSILSTATSSETISVAFTNYQNTVESQGLPTEIAAAERDGQYQKDKADVDSDTQVETYKNTCEAIRQQLDTRDSYGI